MSGARTIREAAGISQEKLAETSGVSIRTIRRLESDCSYQPSMRSAIRIADALDTTVDDLVVTHAPDRTATGDSHVEIGGRPAPVKKRATSTTKAG